MVGREKLAELAYPTGEEVFSAVSAERAVLDASARGIWPHLFRHVSGEQATVGVASWPAIARWAGEQRPTIAKATVLYCLGLLNAQLLSKDHRMFFEPPTLSQQPQSVVLPRFDKPGYPDKVFAIFIEGPAVLATNLETSANADHA